MRTGYGEVRPPGVYPAPEEVQVGPLSIAAVDVAGFVGVATRGPLDRPRRIGSWDEFVDIYGESNEGFLGRAVEGFFENGGRACHVVRVAHKAPPGVVPTAESGYASSAERIAKDAWDKPTLRIRANSEGRWGNGVWVSCKQAKGARALLTMDLEVGAGEAQVNATRGFERGALCRIYDRENSAHVVLTEASERRIAWSSETPIGRRFRAAGPTYVEVLEFEVHAALKHRREAFKALQLSPLSRRYAPRAINDQSQLIHVDDLGSRSPPPHNLPVETAPAKLAGGRDGLEALIADDIIGQDRGPGERTGLMALGAVDEVGVVAVPDSLLFYSRVPGPHAEMEANRIHDAAVTLCERLQDRFVILDCPPLREIEEIVRWRRRVDSSYAAYYSPWVHVTRDDGQRVLVPPSGHVAGVFARCDREAGVHKAPANEVLKGISGVSLAFTETDQGILNSELVNCLRPCPGRGTRVWGARTCSSDQSWRYVNVRRLFIMLRRTFEHQTQWAVFEPNDAGTWSKLSRMGSVFLEDLYSKGYFAGASPEEAFFVKCDAETNTAESRDVGQLVVEVGVAPALPAEFIIFRVTQQLGDQAVMAAAVPGG